MAIEITRTVQASGDAGNELHVLYAFPEDTPRHLRKAAYQASRKALKQQEGRDYDWVCGQGYGIYGFVIENPLS